MRQMARHPETFKEESNNIRAHLPDGSVLKVLGGGGGTVGYLCTMNPIPMIYRNDLGPQRSDAPNKTRPMGGQAYSVSDPYETISHVRGVILE